MSKECPSCHEEAEYIYQCNNDSCRKMYCGYCAPMPGLSYLIPGETLKCPDCGWGGTVVSVDDDD